MCHLGCPFPESAAINPYIAQLTITFLSILMWAVIARSLLSWFPVDQSSAAYQMLYRVTEPIIEPFRRLVPNSGMLDLSPLMAMIALIVMQVLVGNLVAPA